MDFSKPKIMGILNVTPDSFSDGGQYTEKSKIENRILSMIREGVDIIDVGGEPTGPGSLDVPTREELRRITPVVDSIAESKLAEKALFSIDTHQSQVAEYALRHGFKMVNDVTALRGDPGMTEVLNRHKPYVVLMYSKDDSARTTAEHVDYEDVVVSIKTFLVERISLLLESGFPEDRIIIDPGMGMFVSANPKYSFQILERLSEFKSLGYPILVGVSRKSFLGGEVENRDQDSVKWSLTAIKNGASIIRIHDSGGMISSLS